MKIAQAVASKKQSGQQVGSSEETMPIEKAGDQVKDGAQDGCQPVVQIEGDQVPSKNTDMSAPNSSLIRDSDAASLPGLGEKTSTSESAPAPHSSPDEQNPHMEPEKTGAASSDATSTVDQKAQNLKKAKPGESSENDTKEGTQGMS